jgi:hypothetical protein
MSDVGNTNPPATPPPATGAPATPPTAPAAPPPPATGQPAKTYTAEEHQAELSRIAAAEASQAERRATAKLLADLGVEKIEDAQAILTARKAEDDKNLSDAEKANRDATEREAKAKKAEAAADAKLRTAEISLGLVNASIADPAVRADLATLVERELGDKDATTEHVTAAIDAVKTRLPALFGAPAAPSTGTPPPAGKPPAFDPGKPPPAGQPSQSTMDKGAARARRMQGREDPAKQPTA